MTKRGDPGQPPAPNAVTTGLDPAGMFTMYNAFGTVDVIVDVNGYYEDHNHDDRYVQLDSMMWAVVETEMLQRHVARRLSDRLGKRKILLIMANNASSPEVASEI